MSSSISLLSVYPVKINLVIDDNAAGEIVSIKTLDYLFVAENSLKYDISNIDNAVDKVQFVEPSDLPSSSNIRLGISSSDNYSYLASDTSIDSIMTLIIKNKIGNKYDIYLDSIKSEIVSTTVPNLINLDLTSYIDESLLIVYKFTINHSSTEFISTFGDYLTLNYPDQQSFELVFGLLYKIGP